MQQDKTGMNSEKFKNFRTKYFRIALTNFELRFCLIALDSLFLEIEAV